VESVLFSGAQTDVNA